jgi:CRP/FNR family transcriptional regulator, anaerobic regulatory protein
MEPVSIDGWPDVAALPMRALPAGSLLFDETRPCEGFPLVDAGGIKVFKAFPNGRELLLYRVTPGQACIVSAAALFSSQPYSACGMADTDVRFRMIPAALFETLMGEARFRRFVMWQFTQRLADLMTLVDAVFTRRLDQRLAARLLVHRADGSGTLAITHQQLADELGSIREVVTRLLRHFADEGWITVERGAVRILDAGGLKRFSEPSG